MNALCSYAMLSRSFFPLDYANFNVAYTNLLRKKPRVSLAVWHLNCFLSGNGRDWENWTYSQFFAVSFQSVDCINSTEEENASLDFYSLLIKKQWRWLDHSFTHRVLNTYMKFWPWFWAETESLSSFVRANIVIY